MNTPSANDHPFQLLFETLGRIPSSHAESVNRQAYEVLADLLSVPLEKNGRCVLLRAPRAGHGKTHLLSRIQHFLGSTHEFIPLQPGFGCRIDASTVIDDTLRRLLRPLPASGGLCVLDLVTRRLFANALQPLVGSGEVPCQDREGALSALRTRPIETFDFHHPNAVTAHWARENFEILGQRLSVELAQRCDLPVREIAFWVDALFRFAATPIENPARAKSLADIVHQSPLADGEAIERLAALLGLISQLMRVVLVADDLEGFSSDENAALRLASFLGSIRHSVERLDVILSLNQDIWESAFMPRLSGGLSDRLSEVVIELHPLTEAEMVALLESRVPGLGGRVLDRIDVKSAGTHARGLIRAAGLAWLKATAMDSPPAAILAAPDRVMQPEPALAPPALPAAEPKAVAPAASIFEQAAPSAPVATPSAAEITPAQPAPVAPAFTPVAAPEPVQAPAPVVETVEAPPAPPAEFVTEIAPPEPPPVDLPLQPDVPVFIPETAPVFDLTQAVVESPFQAPQVDSPFQPEPQPIFNPAPPPLVEDSSPNSPFFAAPVDSPFQAIAASEPAPAPHSFPATWPPVSPPTFETDPVIFPPQIVREFAAPAAAVPQPIAADPIPPVSQQAAGTFNPEIAMSFFPPTAPAAAPEVAIPAPAAEPAPPPPAADTDRVDELLRQFRERYGRGSL